MTRRLTRTQAREIDRQAAEKFGMPTILLMENAARSFIELTGDLMIDRIGVLCGSGNNGGDGLAIARHLMIRAKEVAVVMAVNGDKLKGDALTNWKIYSAIGGKFADDLQRFDVVVDALFGTGLSRPISDEMAGYVNACQGKQVVSVDIPSGLDCDTGEPLGEVCVRAVRTVTFVAEKAGFENPNSKAYTGEIRVGDIGFDLPE